MTATEIHRPPETKPTAPAASPSRWLGAGLFLLGLGAAVVAVLGPLVLGVVRYHASEGTVNQVMGGDVAGLVLVAPASMLAAILVLRRHVAGPVLALGPALYALYMYSQLALGGDFSRYAGNTERFFPLYLGLFVLAGAIAIRSWTLVESERLPVANRRVDRTVGVFFLVVAGFLTVGLHLPGLLDVWSGQPTAPEYLTDPQVFWLVKFMDLGLVVPGLVAAGVGVLRRVRWADEVKYAAIVWSALLGASVAGMGIVMQVTGDPAVTVAGTVAFSSFAVIALALTGALYRPLFTDASYGAGK